MKKLSFIPLLIFLLINIQCGGGGDDRTHSGTTPVSIKVTEVTPGTGSGSDQLSGAVRTGDLTSAVEQGDGEGRQLSLCRITITGPGMTDIVHEEDILGKPSIRVTIDVPSGLNRSFLIQMFIENNDIVIVQANSAGHNLEEGVPVDLIMKPEFEDAYEEAPTFSGIDNIENSESKSVMLNWHLATDNITEQERIQYLIYLSNESLSGRDDVNCNNLTDDIYILGKGVLGGDPIVTINGNTGLMSYEYDGPIPANSNSLLSNVGQETANGKLNSGETYYFILEAQDEWGNVDRKCMESDPIIVYQLNVNTLGNGRVITEPKGIDCGAKCSEDFLSKKAVTLTAEADEGAEFEGWTENDQCIGTGDCVLTLSNNESITAKFCQKTRYYLDADGDGYGGSATYIDSCTEPDQDNYVANDDDCDDNNDNINPGAAEFCGNDVDENCDGIAEKDCDCNVGDTRPCGIDTGECEFGVESCTVNREWSGFCDDEIAPTDEICDGLDNDCNGQIDENLSRPTTCGEGQCAGNTGEETCTNGEWGNDTCDPLIGAGIELCDGVDNDCNSATADGSDESWYNTECDGNDTDECKEGKYECTDGSQTCSDNTGNTKDICDGEDNDCDPSTADGSGESWIGDDCDGNNDTDKCKEGQYECTGGSKTCSDNTSSTKDLCDGKDNDCNSATADGSDESWYNTNCDGNDTDECEEGKFQCTNKTKTCSDKSGNNKEVCDGEDNDCDGVPDGSENLTQQCGDTNVGECSYGTETCNDSGKWINCDAVYPSDEICTDNKDNDCDGLIDSDDTGDCFVEPCGGCPDDQICIDGQCEPKTLDNSCEKRGKCCRDQDNSCTAPDGACYCDEFCEVVGDCCADFQSWCPGNFG